MAGALREVRELLEEGQSLGRIRAAIAAVQRRTQRSEKTEDG
jgi:hypothetical protein